MPYWRLFYHVVWATKERHPLIGEAVEQVIIASPRSTCQELKVIPHAIGLMADHAHLAVSIPPGLAVSTVIGRLKGAASHAVNATGATDDAAFARQTEYGVLSFGDKALPDVADYVANQKARHAANRLCLPLERTDDRTQPA